MEKAGLNFLYLLGPLAASPWQNNELRYSLRSIEFLNPAWIGIVGPEIPEFLSGITHIEADTSPYISKYENTQRQLRTACLSGSVPEKLILMNDDFLMRPSPVWDWTPTFIQPIPYRSTQISEWIQSVIETGRWLRSSGIANPLSYEGHTPMPFQKSLALSILDRLLGQEKILQFRSVYGNLANIGGKLHPNAKRANPDAWPADSPFWSLKGRPDDKAKTFLENWLPKPSRWERQ